MRVPSLLVLSEAAADYQVKKDAEKILRLLGNRIFSGDENVLLQSDD